MSLALDIVEDSDVSAESVEAGQGWHGEGRGVGGQGEHGDGGVGVLEPGSSRSTSEERRGVEKNKKS